ncbi:unnamed protein product [Meloidogyne enterolobii]|uniref:Uncharacterized protein n=3 Tax=Meloidogyne TaxID=189290 RepID=A0ACB1AMI8_MELEN|nr:unnamed protein product [Meloidogyne enterolobii]
MSSSKSSTSSSTQQPTVVDINSLTIEELSGLQQQLSAELSFFNESLNELRSVSNRFGRCQVTLDSINPEEKNKKALIPLSESVYIEAKVIDPDKYLVEIGAGYFARMNRKQALDYFKRKYAFLDGQINTINKSVIPEKQQLRQMVLMALQKKIQATTSAK